ncbi:MAG TPA: alpha-E domain-containing protein [Polyangiaceae bacterium]|nr:alpha-E domain-containing protein [Polyangiaceae bacterium]
MLSRVADAIYWASRYVERAENVARFIDVSLNLMLESSGDERDWAALVHTTGDQEFFEKKYGAATPENVTQFLTFDEEYSSSILSSVARARENARSVRDIISREMWQELNEFYLMVVQSTRPGAQPEDLIDFCARVKRAGIYFEGVTNATLSRGEAFHFAHLGRMLERADKTSRILDVKYFLLSPPAQGKAQSQSPQSQSQSQNGVGNVDLGGWTTLLNSASALQMYRQIRHVTTPEAVSEFLLLDRNFPRSILRCVRRAQESLHCISGEPLGSFKNESERLLGRLRSELDYARIEEIMAQGLHQYVDSLQSQINDAGGAIQKQFFDL